VRLRLANVTQGKLSTTSLPETPQGIHLKSNITIFLFPSHFSHPSYYPIGQPPPLSITSSIPLLQRLLLLILFIISIMTFGFSQTALFGAMLKKEGTKNIINNPADYNSSFLLPH
jgi:hypothetical protein